jgi:hypothetical protein
MSKTHMCIAVIAVCFWICLSQERVYSDGICSCKCHSSGMPNPYICGQTCTTNASNCYAFCNRNIDYIGFGFGADGDQCQGVTLYEHVNYGGHSQTFTEDNPDLSYTILGNDTASSLQVSPGCSAILYEHINYGGHSQTFTGDNPDLSHTLIGSDTASSLQVSCH